MAVPSTLASLSTTPSSNPPGGTENPFPELDDHLRQIYSFTALLRDQKAGLAGAQFTGPIAVGIASTADPATFYRATTGNVISLNTPTGVDGVLAMRRGAADVARVFSVFDGMRLEATQVCRVTIAGTERFLVNATGPERTDDAAAANGLVRKSQMDSAVAAAGSGKADVAGSASQVFSVATATDPAHAVRKDQVEAEVKTVMNATGSAPLYGVRAWAQFNGNSPLTINAQGNIASIVRLGTGDYEVTFTQAMPSANYAIGGNGGANDRGHTYNIVTRSTTGFRFQTHSDFGGSYPLTDRADISILVVC